MDICRDRVVRTFIDYVNTYDRSNRLIILKEKHTVQVAKLVDEISIMMNISKEDQNLAWLIAMLHDIGRFEQIQTYNTLSDKESISHAQNSIKILFDGKELLRYLSLDECGTKIDYLLCDGKVCFPEIDDIKVELSLKCIFYAIYYHSDFNISIDNEKELFFCNILRDADKIDILRINSEYSIEELYNERQIELGKMKISNSVYEAFMDGREIPRNIMQTTFDKMVGQISMIYGLANIESITIVKQNEYVFSILNQILKFSLENQHIVERINAKIEQYMNDRIRGK